MILGDIVQKVTFPVCGWGHWMASLASKSLRPLVSASEQTKCMHRALVSGQVGHLGKHPLVSWSGIFAGGAQIIVSYFFLLPFQRSSADGQQNRSIGDLCPLVSSDSGTEEKKIKHNPKYYFYLICTALRLQKHTIHLHCLLIHESIFEMSTFKKIKKNLPA